MWCTLSVSLDAEGDHIPQNEGAPDGPVSFLWSPSPLSWQSHGFCECLMKSSLLILVVFFFFLCACACVCTHMCSIPFACSAEQFCQKPDRTQCLSNGRNPVALESCLSSCGALSCPRHLSLAFGVRLSNPFAFRIHHHPLRIISCRSWAS